MITEPKENPEEALKFATAFEQGAQQKKEFRVKTTIIKGAPGFAVEKNNECYKYGKNSFQLDTKRFARQKTMSAETVEKQDIMPACAEKDNQEQNEKNIGAKEIAHGFERQVPQP